MKVFFLVLVIFIQTAFAVQAQAVTNVMEVVIPSYELNTKKSELLHKNSTPSEEGKLFSEIPFYIGGKFEKFKIYRDLDNLLRVTPKVVERIYLLDRTIVGVALRGEYSENGIHRLTRFSSDWKREK